MSLFSRLFGKRHAPVVDRRETNDWKAGDLAVCVADDWINNYSDDPKVGEVRRVSGIEDGIGNGGCRAYYLSFHGHRHSWESSGFRKPQEDSEPAEEEFTALIKRPVRKSGRVRA